MLNSKPNNKNYHQGNFIPVNKDNVYKLNNEGGLYFRSGLERKMMFWLDTQAGLGKILIWGCENLEIPYEMTHFENGDAKIKRHRYYPDFYYRIKESDGSIKDVVVEVKPQKEYEMVLQLQNGKINVTDGSLKKLKSQEYDVKMAYKNMSKWETMINWCNKKGYNFIIITEKHLGK